MFISFFFIIFFGIFYLRLARGLTRKTLIFIRDKNLCRAFVKTNFHVLKIKFILRAYQAISIVGSKASFAVNMAIKAFNFCNILIKSIGAFFNALINVKIIR